LDIAPEERAPILRGYNVSIPIDRHLSRALDSEICRPVGILIFFQAPGVGIYLNGIFSGIGE
jgi:hypothetical protein